MLLTSKFIPTQQAQEAETRIWGEQKGAKHEDPPCSRFIWYASSNYYYWWNSSRLFNGWWELIEGFDADYLLADRGYDTDRVIEQAIIAGMETVIPPKKNRKKQREYDKDIYENRYQVEKSFLKLKYWRGIATRYAKTTLSLSYKASVQICCVFMWLNILWRHSLNILSQFLNALL